MNAYLYQLQHLVALIESPKIPDNLLGVTYFNKCLKLL